ncbi:MAG TPA: class I SAM-dependent methyltransferase [Candidatus Dormibacteraeota bacterium]|nr:class I SAM-dependent methyltransferase [Candidatus Dormibacteraeota bacterium]
MVEKRHPAGGPTFDAAGQPTGERLVPELMGGGLLEAEHQVRYQFAAQVAKGRTVLDAGCGVGWGLAVLLGSGASEGTGMDLSAEAVAEARQRLAGVAVIQADLCSPPGEIGRYGLVTCFEVLEHIEDYGAALDALARALDADGILMVSSPNPGIYPPGNPFHVHELAPTELLKELAARLPYTALWHQRAVVGSLLRRSDQAANWPNRTEIQRLHALPTVDDGQDQYSVVVASSAPLPVLGDAGVLASSEQLDQLANLSESLDQDRREVWVDHQRIVEERQRLLTEVDGLRSAEAALKRSEAGATRALAAMQRRQSDLAEDLIYARRELDRISLLLLQSEQECATYVLAEVEATASTNPAKA